MSIIESKNKNCKSDLSKVLYAIKDNILSPDEGEEIIKTIVKSKIDNLKEYGTSGKWAEVKKIYVKQVIDEM